MNEIIGRSSWTRKIQEAIARVAASNCTVLIEGPTGTGKDLIARAIHAQSHRRQQTADPGQLRVGLRDLFASELFGHVKGAYSGPTPIRSEASVPRTAERSSSTRSANFRRRFSANCCA